MKKSRRANKDGCAKCDEETQSCELVDCDEVTDEESNEKIFRKKGKK